GAGWGGANSAAWGGRGVGPFAGGGGVPPGGGGPPEKPSLNRRTEAMVGRVFTLDKPIVNAAGTIRIDDTIWRVTGPDAPAGSRVRVKNAEGVQLEVEQAE